MRRSDIFWAIILVMIVLSLVSCKTRYVEVETIKTDTLYQHSLEYDSIYWYGRVKETLKDIHILTRDTIIRDSVVIVKSDSIIEKVTNHYEKIVIREVDSLYNSKKVDDIKREYEVKLDSLNEKINNSEKTTKEVRMPLRWYEKTLIALGGLFVMTIIYKIIDRK